MNPHTYRFGGSCPSVCIAACAPEHLIKISAGCQGKRGVVPDLIPACPGAHQGFGWNVAYGIGGSLNHCKTAASRAVIFDYGGVLARTVDLEPRAAPLGTPPRLGARRLDGSGARRAVVGGGAKRQYRIRRALAGDGRGIGVEQITIGAGCGRRFTPGTCSINNCWPASTTCGNRAWRWGC